MPINSRPPLQGSAPQSEAKSRFVPGFKTFRVQTSGATINGVIGGQGPPLLLLHGAPQSHISWRIVAPKLAAEYTVVAPDLPAYSAPTTPPAASNPSTSPTRT